jgi:hypothetical protein
VITVGEVAGVDELGADEPTVVVVAEDELATPEEVPPDA